MKYFTTLLPVLIAGISFTSCTKEVSGPGEQTSTAKIDFQMNNTERSGSFYAVRGPQTGGHAQSGIVTWSDGFISPATLTIKSANSDKEYTASVNPTPGLFNAGSMAIVDMSAGNLLNAEYTLNIKPVNGAAFELRGEYVDNNATTFPVILLIDDNLQLKATSESAIEMASGKIVKAVSSIGLGTMLETIPETLMTQATLQSNGGPVIISSTQNTALYNMIKSILPGTFKVNIVE